MPSPRILWLPVSVALALVLTACGSALPRQTSVRDVSAATRPAPPRIIHAVAAGDIACPPGEIVTPTSCRQADTAAIAQQLHPNLVLTLGDHQYEKGSLAEFQGSYAHSWGALLSKTRPAIGNHEYETPGATGYYTYFKKRQPGPPGYYRVKAGAWQIFVLNSNCDKVRCGREAIWLDRQMKAHPSRCSMITMHHPRYSSGSAHGNDPALIPLWKAAYKHHADLALAGHDHDYERFKRMDAVGHLRPTRGLVEFVVGTGGRSLRYVGTRKPGSAYAQASRLGVLQLSLGPRRFSWVFRDADGGRLDAGSRACI